MPLDREMMQRWEALSQQCNVVFAGQPMEDVGGALALLTAMLIAGMLQGEDVEDGADMKRKATVLMAQHGTLVINLIPSFLEAVEEVGGWENIGKKGRH
ncbi:MAG: hypothetical protein EHM67_06475 [Hyphomicrobiaceae bacterium]|nr:MAG: hypothetical protein EHM67_06475 [Hyphomicrobiaceae bacterium]